MNRALDDDGAAGHTAFRVSFPGPDVSLAQDKEWCVVHVNGEWHEIRFHDYAKIYEIPGFYEYLFYDLLKYRSPAVVCELLDRMRHSTPGNSQPLRVLDLGAGNGLVGKQLADMGAHRIVGVDILPQAARAAARDYPGVYETYFVRDMTRLTERQRDELMDFEFNCLTCVAAAGFGGVPPLAFAEAYNLIAPGGWLAFNLKEDFLVRRNGFGFARLIQEMISDGTLSIRTRRVHQHRLSTDGRPIMYLAFGGQKIRDVELPDY
jgi:SAM-dependent methyltransferase